MVTGKIFQSASLKSHFMRQSDIRARWKSEKVLSRA